MRKNLLTRFVSWPTGRSEETVSGERRKVELPVSAKFRYLSAMRIFADLSPDEIHEIERATTMVTHPPGKIFYIPGETGEVLYLLKRGRVHLYRLSPEGRKLILATLEPGVLFGEMALFGQGMYDTYAEAAEECLLCVMSRQDVKRLLLSKPHVTLRVLEEMSRRLLEAENLLEEIAFRNVPRRLAALLLRLSNGRGEIVGYSHQDLAEMLGVYRETVTLCLDEFKRRGLVEIGRKRIRLVRPERLRELSPDEK